MNEKKFTFTFKDPGNDNVTLEIVKHHARFLRADTSSRRSWSNQYYYRMFTRNRSSRERPTTIFASIRARGFVRASRSFVERTTKATRFRAHIHLKEDGSRALNFNEAFKLWFLKYGKKDFKDLL